MFLFFLFVFLFFFNDTATTEIYTLSLHDALPICGVRCAWPCRRSARAPAPRPCRHRGRDRKSTRLNSSHVRISYAVFCLKKKKKKLHITNTQYNELDQILHNSSLDRVSV